MIDKLQPRKLDRDSDERLIQKTSMIDALNIYIDENIDGESGDAGVIKPIKGTDLVEWESGEAPSSYDQDNSFRVLGSVTDETTNVVYFFTWSTSVQGVFAYDPDGVLPIASSSSFVAGGANKVREVFTSDVFNFSPNSFIKADVVYTSRARADVGNLPDNDALIYFTDGVNEPRKLNVYRVMTAEGIKERTAFDINDFLCVCPKVPMGNIDYEFLSDESVEVSNFENTPGFQFAIQGVYYDGSTTAIGPYSDIAFPASVVNRGARATADTIKHNLCRIMIPSLPEEIESVKILARQGNSANFIEIVEVPNAGGSNDPAWVNTVSERHYDFYNDKIALGVSPSEVDKVFDNVPRRAKAQSSIANRMVYGNFIDGYNPTDVSAEIVPVYKDRPSEGVDFSIQAISTIVTDSSGQASSPFNKHSGFEIDVSELPETIPSGTKLEFAVVLNPANNFHVYESRKAYHQTRANGWSMFNLKGYPKNMGSHENDEGPRGEVNNKLNAAEGTPAYFQEIGGGGQQKMPWDNGTVSGAGGVNHAAVRGVNNEAQARSFFGRNLGVGYRRDGANSGASGDPFASGTGTEFSKPPRWNSKFKNNSEFQTLAGYGTSAGAPLILKGGPVKFRVGIKAINEIAFNAPNTIRDVIKELLLGNENPLPDTFEVTTNEATFDHEIDLQLSNKQQLNTGSPIRDLITAVAEVGDGLGIPANTSAFIEGNKRVPIGYFVVNKATVKFSLQSEEDGSIRDNLHLAIDDIVLDDDGIYTCLRKADPGSPWWVLSPDEVDAAITSGNQPTGIGNWSDKIFENTNDSFKFNLSTYDVDDNVEAGIVIGERFIGRLKWKSRDGEAERPFWPCKKEDGAGAFRFSLMDGAAGPGGLNPGDESAWAKYGVGSQGSVSGSVVFTHFGVYKSQNGLDSTGDIRRDLLEDIYSLVPFKAKREHSICVSGQLLLEEKNNFGSDDAVVMRIPEGGTQGVGRIINTNRADNSRIPSDRVIRDEQMNIDNVGSTVHYPAVAVFSGPFFTGKINTNSIMSPVEGGTLKDIANLVRGEGGNIAGAQKNSKGETNVDTVDVPSTYEFLNGGMLPNGVNDVERSWLPPAPDQTTVLPYVMYSDIKDTARENFKLFRSSYPVPILDEAAVAEAQSLADEGVLSFSDLASDYNIALNPDPFGYADLSGAGYNASHPGYAGISYSPQVDEVRPHVDVTSARTSSSIASSKPTMSFKSNATHEFGVVYFDERGRRGPVNPVGTVFVPGYSEQERGNAEGGPVFVNLSITSDPPPWAHHYKVVYSKNTSVSDFFQYSTEGAYSVVSNEEENPGAKIYLSLNYLQGHPISYSDAWGAKSQDGSPVVFQPEQGDKVRVISYNVILDGDSQEKIFPRSVQFDVVGVESLSENNNPLIDDSIETPDVEYYNSKQGLFLVLRDNPEAQGFNLTDVRAGNDLWGQNVVFEIYRPVKEIDPEKRLYYEIGSTYSIRKNENGTLEHLNEENEASVLEVSQGDVYFRLTALNQKPVKNGGFENLIKESLQLLEDGDTVGEGADYQPESQPNFISIFTESNSASDLFKSDAKSIGRPCKIDSNAKERDRSASLIHSDRDILKKKKLGYSSFNPSEATDEDLDVTRGAITYMESTDDSIFCIQEKKTSQIPVDRNIISTADSEQSLISSSKVLGTPRYFASEAGSDSPESVAKADNTFYFANKKTGNVFRFSGSNGVTDISAKGMKSFFRNLFSSLSKSDKIIGGYDPKKEEYLLTVRQDSAGFTQNGVYIDQGDTPVQVFGESPGNDISINIFDIGIPEDLLNDNRFTSTAQVNLGAYYQPCCSTSGDVFAPVDIAINGFAQDDEQAYTITDDIRLYLDYAKEQQTTTDSYSLRAGEVNTIITNSIRAQGFPEAVVAPFSQSNGDNLYFEFNTDCNAQNQANTIYNAGDFQDWAVQVWGAPFSYTPSLQGTGFNAESFIVEISSLLQNEEVCFYTYNDLYNIWSVQYAEGETFAWNEDGTMTDDSEWSVSSDGGGIPPAKIIAINQLKQYLTDESIGWASGYSLNIPADEFDAIFSDPEPGSEINLFFQSYLNTEGGLTGFNYPLALFQIQDEFTAVLAEYFDLDITAPKINSLWRANGFPLKTWESITEGQSEQGGGDDDPPATG